MNYGILAVDVDNVNLGNRLTEYAMKKVLDLPEPSVSVSMFRVPSGEDIERLNTCQFVLLPGATILANEEHQGLAMNYLSQIKVPKFCCAAAGWRPCFSLNVGCLRYIDGPIGVRDPDTLVEVQAAGYTAVLVGCPTALVPQVPVEPPPVAYDVIGFARSRVPWQLQLFHTFMRRPLVASVQEPTFEQPILRRVTGASFSYENPQEVYKRYAGASAVYTGRLHGALPAISQWRPVAFFGDLQDSRFTLLQYLGVHIAAIGTTTPLRLTYPERYLGGIAELQEAMRIWRGQTVGRFA
jgi:hypothetical protein